MTLQARTGLNLIAGAIGGFLAWVIIDLTGWFTSVTIGAAVITPWTDRFYLLLTLGGTLGGFIGLLLGLVGALAVDSFQQRAQSLVIYAAVGFAGGCLGIFFGQEVYAFIGPKQADLNTAGLFLQSLIGKALGWALIGAGVGVSQGVARRSLPLIQQGLFGGFAGGLVGGVIFQSTSSAIGLGSLGRLLGVVSIGASTGFFIGLIQTLFRQAWIRVVLGRNEGKEYLIDKPVMIIGRSELADIGLFGNAKILPNHCAIEQQEGRYRLTVIKPDTSTKRNVTPSDVKVNGLVVNPDVWLTDGDSIAIDDRTLQFRERLTQRTQPKPTPAPTFVAAPVKKPAASVTVIEGGDIGKTFTLNGADSLIGRTDDCTVCLTSDTLVSRRHAVLQLTGDQWSVTDSGSANGTYVNNARLEPSSTLKVRSGDHIRVGTTVLRLDT